MPFRTILVTVGGSHRWVTVLFLGLIVLFGHGLALSPGLTSTPLSAQESAGPVERPSGQLPAVSAAIEPAREYSEARLQADRSAVASFPPAFPVWRHLFMIPDGHIIFGSAKDGRLLAVFPSTGDWARGAVWEDSSLAAVLDKQQLPRQLSDRRLRVVQLLEPITGSPREKAAVDQS